MFSGLLSNRDIQWMKLTKRPHNHSKLYFLEKFSCVQKWQNSSSGSDKIKIFIYKVSFTLHLLVELIHNSTIAKEQTNRTSQCLQNRVSKLVSSLLEHKKGREFALITMLISYKKSYKIKFCLIYSVIGITLHNNCGQTVEILMQIINRPGVAGAVPQSSP